MPVYEYACQDCGQRTERLLPHARAATPGPCPDCAGTLQRRYSRVGVRLNGWGFSRTDGFVPDRPGRGEFRTVSERAERIADGGS
ncbi:FmdB family zinc ribbon protein [Egicoccus halophilus]|uniref:Putative regulatory protein FmdB zinc ribbon domain-containing protein n=1 Tax=Egicoccus halophilus TaxID=1670830 RepID=A0A8J3A5H4_9ACTN|nr:zinc ribbon domain-containing protein [Egicoccus halophilus]GGI02972.1 hypothetical protein GCM10011354_02180 [Egicoccus halophilus]